MASSDAISAAIAGGAGVLGAVAGGGFAALSERRRLAVQTLQAEIARGDAAVAERRQVYLQLVVASDALAPLLRMHKVRRADFTAWSDVFQEATAAGEITGDARVAAIAKEMRAHAEALRVALSDRPPDAFIGWDARYYWFATVPPKGHEPLERFHPPQPLPCEAFRSCRRALVKAMRDDLGSDEPPRPPGSPHRPKQQQASAVDDRPADPGG